MDERFYAVIMAGGRGERFWPLSTRRHPKQSLTLIGGRSLMAQAVERLEGLIPPERILVITSAELVEPLQAEVPHLPAANIIGEPVGRDTAAACALGNAIVKARCADGVLCMLTADHVIRDVPCFQRTLRAALQMAAAREVIVTIGIEPRFPSTGFGYIECGTPAGAQDGVAFLQAVRFVEKPDAATATGYLESGHYLWNAGMFIWAVDTFAAALKAFRPPLQAMCERLLPLIDSDRFAAALAEAYSGLERISVDFAIMEHAANIVVTPGRFPWFDVGAWPALTDHFEADADGNVVIGDCRALDATGNIVVSASRLTALIGVHDLVIVHAEGATLVCHRDQAQQVKDMVTALAGDGRFEALL